MSPDGRGIRVVQVHHRFTQNLGEIAAHIETRPIAMNKIRRAFCAEHPGCALGAGSVEADGDHVLATENLRSQLVDRDIQPSQARKAALFQLAGSMPGQRGFIPCLNGPSGRSAR